MRSIIQDPNPILKERSEEIKEITAFVNEVAGEMLHYLELPNCGGIAAVQLGVKLRMIAVDRSGESLVIINPVISQKKLRRLKKR